MSMKNYSYSLSEKQLTKVAARLGSYNSRTADGNRKSDWRLASATWNTVLKSPEEISGNVENKMGTGQTKGARYRTDPEWTGQGNIRPGINYSEWRWFDPVGKSIFDWYMWRSLIAHPPSPAPNVIQIRSDRLSLLTQRCLFRTIFFRVCRLDSSVERRMFATGRSGRVCLLTSRPVTCRNARRLRLSGDQIDCRFSQSLCCWTESFADIGSCPSLFSSDEKAERRATNCYLSLRIPPLKIKITSAIN